MPPSIVAVVATVNGQNNSYRAEIRLQEGRQEIIQDMRGCTLALLRKYRASNGNKEPKKIIFYRDSVSEGMYEEVSAAEIKSIREACRMISPTYKPQLIFIVCGKRHHIRFFGAGGDVDRSGNCPAGTVVDKAVTHPFAFDFYLQAHSGLVGTARSAHYIVLVDDTKSTPDSQCAFSSRSNFRTRCRTDLTIPFLSTMFPLHIRHPEAHEQPVLSVCPSDTISLSVRVSATLLRPSARVPPLLTSHSHALAHSVPPCYYADIICTQIRPLVYSLDSLDTSTQASGTTGRSGQQPFDPMKIATLLNKSEAFNGVQWSVPVFLTKLYRCRD